MSSTMCQVKFNKFGKRDKLKRGFATICPFQRRYGASVVKYVTQYSEDRRKLIKRILFVICVVLSGQLMADEPYSELELNDIRARLSEGIWTFNWLQLLQIGEVESARDSMISHLGFNILYLDNFIKLDGISKEDKEQFSQQLVLLAVMLEKYDIKEWRENESIYGILVSAKESHPEQYRSLQCQDWSQPAWVGDPKC